MKIHVITASEVRAAGVEIALTEVPCTFAKVNTPTHFLLPVALADLEPGDISKLTNYLKCQPSTLILADWFGSDEIELSSDAASCRVARASFRSFESKAHGLIALPPVTPDLDFQSLDAVECDLGFYGRIDTGLDLNVLNSLEKLRRSNREKPPIVAEAIKPRELAFVSGLLEKMERGSDGRLRVPAGMGDIRQLVEGIPSTVDVENSNANVSVLIKTVNQYVQNQDQDRKAFGYRQDGATDLTPQERSLLNLHGGILLGTGETNDAEYRAVLAKSKSAVCVSRFGSLPPAVISAASAGRCCWVVGHIERKPFGLDTSEFLFEIPSDVDAGSIISSLHKKVDYAACGAAARKWFERITAGQAALLAGVL